MAERGIVVAILRLLKKTPNSFCWKEHGGMYELPAYVHACAHICRPIEKSCIAENDNKNGHAGAKWLIIIYYTTFMHRLF